MILDICRKLYLPSDFKGLVNLLPHNHYITMGGFKLPVFKAMQKATYLAPSAKPFGHSATTRGSHVTRASTSLFGALFAATISQQPVIENNDKQNKPKSVQFCQGSKKQLSIVISDLKKKKKFFKWFRDFRRCKFK